MSNWNVFNVLSEGVCPEKKVKGQGQNSADTARDDWYVGTFNKQYEDNIRKEGNKGWEISSDF